MGRAGVFAIVIDYFVLDCLSRDPSFPNSYRRGLWWSAGIANSDDAIRFVKWLKSLPEMLKLVFLLLIASSL